MTPRENVKGFSKLPSAHAAADAIIDSLESVGIDAPFGLVAIALSLHKLLKAQTPNPGQEENAREWKDALYEVARNGEVKNV